MIKGILSWALSYRVGQLRYLAAKTYIETASQVHVMISVILGMIFFIALTTGGIVLLTLGAALTWAPVNEVRGDIILLCGAVVTTLSLTGYMYLNSEKVWVKALRVESVLKEISR